MCGTFIWKKNQAGRIKMSFGKTVRKQHLQNGNITETLPPLVVKSGTKVGLKVDEQKQVSFTSLYRKAVINKGFHNEPEMNRKEMEFMGLCPSTCSKSPGQTENFRKNQRKSEIVPPIPNDQV